MRQGPRWLRTLSKAAVAAFALAFSVSNAAAGSDYLVRHWDTDDGLPQNSVLDLVQTADGYVWLATFGGLARFDGIRLTPFDSGMTPGLTSNRILSLAEGRDGSLWIATQESGISRYKDGVFRNYTERDGLASHYTHVVSAARDGTIWIATRKGLMTFREGRFEAAPWPEGLLPDIITSLAESRDGSILAGTSTGVLRFRSGQPTIHYRVSTAPVLALRSDRNGVEWIGTSKGLYRLDALSEAVAPVAGEIWAIREDKSGSLWAGGTGGLWRRWGESWTHYTTSDGLSENGVRSMAEDSEGNIWIGTGARGLNRLTRRRIDVFGTGLGFPSGNMVPVLEDREGALWFGTTCGGLIRYKDGRYQRFTEKTGLSGDCVWSLWEDREGAIWAGTRDGVSRLRNGVFTNYTPRSGLTYKWVTAIYQDRYGRMWFGTGSGLNRMDGETFTAIRKADGLVEDDIRFITEDREGALWIGTTGGLSRFHNGSFLNYTTANGLPHNFVRAIHFDGSGTVWIGTYGGGLARLKDGRFSRFDLSNGLPENIISRILEDSEGNFWLSGNRGIHRVNRQELSDYADGKAHIYQVSSYGTADGMKSAECNGGGSPAGWKGRDGRLWFPTQQGAVVIDPKRLASNSQPPAVLIEQALIDRKPAGLAPGIRMEPGKTDLEIRFAGMSFSAPERVRMQYRLEGIDPDWVEAGPRRSAYYTHLPAGTYSFRVRAANSDGVWNIREAAVGVQVIPPFRETLWFRVVVILSAIGGLGYLYRRRGQAARREAAQLQAYSRQLIASQESERQRLAGELHDSLGQTLAIIQNRALLSLNEPGNQTRAIEQLDEIAHAASHALDEVREIAFRLRPYQLDRLGLGKAIEAMLAQAAIPGRIKLTHELDGLCRIFTPDVETNLYRIVQEAVSNIIKHSGATEASVRCQRRGSAMELVVSDNGKGFATPFAMGTAEGFGLHNMAERTRLLGGDLEVQSAPGKGTSIRILLNTEV